jgi:hypothetical protein
MAGAGTSLLAVTRAQWIFGIILALNALLIVFFAVYVAGSTMWGNRWFRRR